jgi:mortality factor 4-like protein 1
VLLPRTPTVSEILRAYSAAEQANRPKRPGSAEADIFDEVISGIKIYFDRCLGNILLYRFERQQYVDVRRSSEGREMSDIYGAEHLLRLFGMMLTHVILTCSLIARFDCTYQYGSTEHSDSKGSY